MSIIETVGSLLFASKRSIMGLFADVVIEEQHTDTLTITDHPVEKGSAISDHAYLAPAEVSMKIGWSESAGKLNKLLGNSFLGGNISLIAVYEGLRLLQSNSVLLLVSTGKRLYTNMLIKSIAVTTDVTSENALMVTLVLRKVNIARSRQTDIYIDQQADPSLTGPVQPSGTKTPVKAPPATQSFLKGLFGS